MNKRTARFTSSEIHRLMSNGKAKGTFGKPFYSYVQEKIWERRLGKSLDGNDGGKATSWGLVGERFVLENLLGMEYIPMMNEVKVHEWIDGWAGSPDALNELTFNVAELKCPYTLSSFCSLAEPLIRGLKGLDAMNFIRENHSDGEKYYWQCVSNFILTRTKGVEFMFFMPQFEQLDEFKRMIDYFSEEDQYKFFWLANSFNKDLPHLIKESEYESLYRIEFVPPKEDVDALTERVKLAIELLNK